MRIDVSWFPLIDLYDGSYDNLIYDCDEEQISEVSGVYVFARCFGDVITPLYVGQAINLRKRIHQQLHKHVKLMLGIKNDKLGKRVVLSAQVSTRLKKHMPHALDIVESSLIEHYLSLNHPLHNIQGTRIIADEIHFSGNLPSRQTGPRQLIVPRRRKKQSYE